MPDTTFQEISSKTFTEFYQTICGKLRSSGSLDDVIKEFEDCKTDLERVQYVAKMKEYQSLDIKGIAVKNKEKSRDLEAKYDALIADESRAKEAKHFISISIQKTPTNDRQALVTRYVKRSWASLLLEQFEDAFIDAQRSIAHNLPVDLIWVAHEVLGHYYAKQSLYKTSDGYFRLALENLRSSNCSKEIKAAATVRITRVYKTVKGRKDNKSKENKSAVKLNLPSVSYGQHKVLESASSAVKVVETETSGRAVIANRDIKPGDILIVEEPFTTTMNPDCLTTHCITCFQRTATPVPCPSCSLVWFCGESCLQKETLHIPECQFLPFLLDECLGKMGLLVFRILQKVTWEGLKSLRTLGFQSHDFETTQFSQSGGWKWLDAKYSTHDYLPTYHLVTNDQKRSFGDLFKRSLAALYITRCLEASGYFGSDNGDQERFFVAGLALRHSQGTSCNAYGITEYVSLSENSWDTAEIGGAVYPTISLTNHSCYPNTIRYCAGTTCILRASRKIDKGSEVLDNYGPQFPAENKLSRMQYLDNQYKFTCTCVACEEDWPLYPHRHEPLTFACPELNCRQPSSYMEGTKTQCALCGSSETFEKLVIEIRKTLEEFRCGLALLNQNQPGKALPLLLKHQMFLDKHVFPPGKALTDTQTALKRCVMMAARNASAD